MMNDKNKKLAIIIAAVAIVAVVLLIFIFKSPVKGKWYMMDDDDMWLKIDGSTIEFYDVFDDKYYGSIDYSLKGDVLQTKGYEACTWDSEDMGRLAEYLNGKSMYVKDGILYLEGLRFSHDIKYKCDH